ncbi:biopolymer transporter ExbD [Solimonas sp. K1W22B-7]|uniref:ExbD/TolR family protein n=1 Tax=Solimonas sp. K1W22B-7 TaxID=2303331 RepID=UPI000E336BDB|nr:biopolymer transporter ExbD [Solimonas sp. K1W22B-7]AXQ29237.1 biopolymer transporter ExbD [Solimonas sp. K1W22B-7]
MAFGGFENKGHSSPMAEINMVPLIDVMLVLLVIFIITAPLLSHAVKIDLPRTTADSTPPEPNKIEFSIDRDSNLFWNGEPVDKATAVARMQEAGLKQPQPELHLRADRDTRYQIIAEVMADAAKSGLAKIGFVSDPKVAAAAASP